MARKLPSAYAVLRGFFFSTLFFGLVSMMATKNSWDVGDCLTERCKHEWANLVKEMKHTRISDVEEEQEGHNAKTLTINSNHSIASSSAPKLPSPQSPPQLPRNDAANIEEGSNDGRGGEGVIIVVGMPKAGTMTIGKFFNCGSQKIDPIDNRTTAANYTHSESDSGSGSTILRTIQKTYHVSHHQCDKGMKGKLPSRAAGRCGVRIQQNTEQGNPPLQGLTANYNVFAQIDAWLIGRKQQQTLGYRCYMPQVEILEDLKRHYPQASFIHNIRDPYHWVRSLRHYISGRMLQEMKLCNITGLPIGVPALSAEKDHDGDDDDIDERILIQFYKDHIDRVRSVFGSSSAQDHKTIHFVEVDIESEDAGQIMEREFGIDRSCWSHANPTQSNK